MTEDDDNDDDDDDADTAACSISSWTDAWSCGRCDEELGNDDRILQG